MYKKEKYEKKRNKERDKWERIARKKWSDECTESTNDQAIAMLHWMVNSDELRVSHRTEYICVCEPIDIARQANINTERTTPEN